MSKIEWTGETWNPIVGCSVVSPGCTNCYAMRMAARLEAMAGDGLDDNGYAVRGSSAFDHYRNLTKASKAGPVWTGKVSLAPETTLLKPLRRRTPTTYFVNSMGDLFHEDVPDEWIDRVFAVMALTPQHDYQVLTKRSARMRAYFDALEIALGETCLQERVAREAGRLVEDGDNAHDVVLGLNWPLPNVWLGVSCEDQRRADERIPDLLATPAAVRFVSAEPLLGPIDFNNIANDGVMGLCTLEKGPIGLDWIVVGGESGPNARSMQREWAESIVRQCRDAGVSVFVKQLGAAYVDEKNGVAGATMRVSDDVSGLISRRLRDRKGANMEEWPQSLRIREMPSKLSEAVA